MLGESAGRTAGNRPRSSARRRMSEDERAEFTHVKDDPQEWPGELKADERPQTTLRQKVKLGIALIVNAILIVTFFVSRVEKTPLNWFLETTLVAYTTFLLIQWRRARRP